MFKDTNRVQAYRKAVTRAAVLVLVLSVCLSLAACATEENAVGTWEGSWTSEDGDISVILNINKDGTYSEESYRNGFLITSESGTWVMDEDETELRLHEPGVVGYTIYEYDHNDRTLVNYGHELKKK